MRLMFPDIKAASQVFGRAAYSYGPLINQISERLCRETYHFEELSDYEIKMLNPASGRSYSGRIYWQEILFRAHLSSVTSIARTTKWAQANANANLYAWSAACRSLLESCGDSGQSLGSVSLTLARFHRMINREIEGRGTGDFIAAPELENTLIHFTHARKISKHDRVEEETHKARQPWEYIKFIEAMKIAGANELYSDLCEIVHPAATSVGLMIVEKNGGFAVYFEQEGRLLSALVSDRRELLSNVLMSAYNPPLLILRVPHKFRLFAQIDALRHYRFDAIPLWK